MNYSVRIMPHAKTDFQNMFDFIWTHSPAGAERWKEAFEAGIERLRSNPFIYGLAPENQFFSFELRQLLFRTPQGLIYRALYQVDEEEVVVFRLCGPGQAPLQSDELSID